MRRLGVPIFGGIKLTIELQERTNIYMLTNLTKEQPVVKECGCLHKEGQHAGQKLQSSVLPGVRTALRDHEVQG